jgi:hypothetical protein
MSQLLDLYNKFTTVTPIVSGPQMAQMIGYTAPKTSHEKPPGVGQCWFLEANHSSRFLMFLTTTSGISYFFYGA